MASKDDLVQQVKQMQKAGARDQWGAYCDQSGMMGKRDPNFYDETFLSTFVESYNLGIKFESPGPQRYAKPGETELVAQVKGIQRQGGKNQWWAYCDEHGGGVHDPAKHEDVFLQAFVTSYDPSANASYGMDFSGGGGSFSGGGSSSSLGDLIKEGQKGSPDFKSAWGAYCATNGNGKNDPSKYNKAFIVGFLDSAAKAYNSWGGDAGDAGQAWGGDAGQAWGGDDGQAWGGDGGQAWGGDGGSYGSAGGNKKGGGAAGPYGGGKGGKGGAADGLGLEGLDIQTLVGMLQQTW